MPPIIIHVLRLFYKKYIVYRFFNMTMHYPQCNYIIVPSFIECATISELRLLKLKKRKMENLQNGLLLFSNYNHSV